MLFKNYISRPEQVKAKQIERLRILVEQTNQVADSLRDLGVNVKFTTHSLDKFNSFLGDPKLVEILEY